MTSRRAGRWARRLFLPGIVLALALPAVLMACGGGVSRDATAPRTVEGYAQLVCAETAQSIRTWGEQVSGLEELLETLEGINPPGELREYHNVTIDVGRIYLAFAKDMPSSGEVDPGALLAQLGTGVMQRVDAAREGLSQETRSILDSAGCDT